MFSKMFDSRGDDSYFRISIGKEAGRWLREYKGEWFGDQKGSDEQSSSSDPDELFNEEIGIQRDQANRLAPAQMSYIGLDNDEALNDGTAGLTPSMMNTAGGSFCYEFYVPAL